MLYVQDYVRVTSDNGNAGDTWFYTYNHSIDHPYFESRPGFVRAKTTYQGMVGVLGDGDQTRLTWLAHLDFGGIVPSAFTTRLLLNWMALPLQVMESAKEYHKKEEKQTTDVARFPHSQMVLGYEPAQVSHEKALKELQEKLKRSEERNQVLREELATSLGDKEVELKRVVTEKNEELRRKDEEHRVVLAEKDKEIMELRRRLPRAADQKV